MIESGDNTEARFPERIVDRAAKAMTWVLPAIASGLVIYLCYPFLKGESSIAWDDNFHQSTQNLTAQTIAAGRNPLGLLPTMFGLPGFRFYQFLQYLMGGTIQLITGLSTTIVHNWMITFLFAATPWSYRKFCLSLGFHPMAAGAAGLLCIGSINGTSNSFEAYYEMGFLTQVLASVLMPLAMAALIDIIKDGRKVVSAGVLMALTVLAHAMFAVYAAFAALLAVLIYLPAKKEIWLKLGTAAVLAGVLAAGWVLPFVHMQQQKKPVSDIVARPDRIFWFAGLAPDEMGRFLVSGRLLDGGEMDDSPDAKSEIKLNMAGTANQRFPFFTLLTGVGIIFAIIGIRDPKNRFLIAGLATGVMFLLGTDDFPLLFRLPLVNKVQAFRVSYFIEFFCMALAAFGAYRLGALAYRLAIRPFPRVVVKYIVVAGAFVIATGFVLTMIRIVTPMMDFWDVKDFDKVVRILNRAQGTDAPKRVAVKFRRPGRKFRYALEHRMEVKGGYQTVCNHWTSPSPTLNLHVCGPLGRMWNASRYARIMGVRFMVIGKDGVDQLLEARPGEYKKLGRTGRMTVVEDLNAAMLHELAGPRVLIVASPGQWYWLSKSWVRRWASKVGEAATPWMLTAPSSVLGREDLIDSVDAVMYLDDSNLQHDLPALKAIARSGKKLISAMDIEGVKTRVFGKDDSTWEGVLELSPREAVGASMRRMDGAEDPGQLVYEVTSSEATLLVLSMQFFDNWRAYVDGESVTVMSTGPDLVAVIVPAGEHEVRFAYEATVLESVSMGISLFGWVGLLGFGVFLGAGRLRRKLRKPTSR